MDDKSVSLLGRFWRLKVTVEFMLSDTMNFG